MNGFINQILAPLEGGQLANNLKADATGPMGQGFGFGALGGLGGLVSALAAKAASSTPAGQKILDQASNAGGGLIPQNTFQPNIPTNTFQATPQASAFDAVTPGINQADFATALQQRLAHDPTGNAYLNRGAEGLDTQQSFADALLGRSGTAYGQQQDVIGQLQQEAAGGGPGAQLINQQLQQANAQNIAQNAGMVASQRGINPALAARISAQNAAQSGQQTAATAAQLGLQNQLAARGQLAGILGGQENLYTGAAGNTLGNVTNSGFQAGLGLGNLENQNLGTIGNLNTAQNQNLVSASLGAQGINAQTAAQNAQLAQQAQATNAGVAAGNQQAGIAGEQIKAGVASGNQQSKDKILGGVLQGAGAAGAAAAGAAHGAEIPGEASVAGDSEANDTVPTMLSPKEIVLPRSVTLAEDAPEKAAEFVAALKGKDKAKSGAKGYGAILEKHRELQKRMSELETIIRRQAS